MLKGLPDPKELRFYFALAQVGMEMVAPMVVGMLLDGYFGWTPWATVAGFTLGFIGGFIHLVLMVQQHDTAERTEPPKDAGS